MSKLSGLAHKIAKPIWLPVTSLSAILICVLIVVYATIDVASWESRSEIYLRVLREWQTGLSAYIGFLGLMAVETLRRDADEAQQIRRNRAKVRASLVALSEEIKITQEHWDNVKRNLQELAQRAGEHPLGKTTLTNEESANLQIPEFSTYDRLNDVKGSLDKKLLSDITSFQVDFVAMRNLLTFNGRPEAKCSVAVLDMMVHAVGRTTEKASALRKMLVSELDEPNDSKA